MEKQSKTFSILALIFGLLGIILTFTPASIVGLILAILGIVFAAIAKTKEAPSGMRTAGLVLSIIALVVWIIFGLIIGILIGAVFGAAGAIGGLF